MNLTNAELQFLEEKCRLTTKKSKSSLSVKDLMEEGSLQFLKHIQPYIGSDKDYVTASLLMKRLALLSVNVLLSFSAYNKIMELKPETIHIDDYIEKELWLPKIRFEPLHMKEIVEEVGAREEARDQLFKILFFDIYTPIIERLSKVANVSRFTLWENVMIYIYWLYETLLPSIGKEDIAGDFEALQYAPSQWFGLNKNPVKYFYSVKGTVAEKAIRSRKTCCFYYETNEEKSRCKTCPLACRNS